MYDREGHMPRTDSDAWNSFQDFPAPETAAAVAEEELKNNSPFSSPASMGYGATGSTATAAAVQRRFADASTNTRSQHQQLGGRSRSEQDLMTAYPPEDEARPLLRPHREKKRDGEATYTD